MRQPGADRPSESLAAYRNYYCRERDTLFVFGDPTPLFEDLDLHLLSLGNNQDPLTRQLLRDGIAAMALYLLYRPRFESFAWTIGLAEPAMNLFFAGSTKDNSVVGRAFHEHIEPRQRTLFHCQSVRSELGVQTSSIDFDGVDIFGMVEQYCAQSDQQPLRIFHRETDAQTALASPFSAGPGAWLEGATAEELFALRDSTQLKFLSEQELRFACSCHRDRILGIVVPLYGRDIESLYQGEEQIEVECPRCGARYVVSRDDYLRKLENPRS